MLLEFPIDDILDWLWDAFELPHLKPRHLGAIDDVRLVRSGLDRHGARSRLDRRRTVKEAIKRRALQTQPVPFTNDDLRYRQVLAQPRPSTNAVVFFVLDVSASMAQAERKLAKSFFFFALQGLRRRYARVETRFIAHTTRAWEFSEAEFFQVNGMGGTMASTAFRLSRELLQEHYAPGRYTAKTGRPPAWAWANWPPCSTIWAMWKPCPACRAAWKRKCTACAPSRNGGACPCTAASSASLTMCGRPSAPFSSTKRPTRRQHHDTA